MAADITERDANRVILVWGVSAYGAIPSTHRPPFASDLSERFTSALWRLSSIQPDLTTARDELLKARNHRLTWTSVLATDDTPNVCLADVAATIEKIRNSWGFLGPPVASTNTSGDDTLMGNTGHGLTPSASAGNGAEQLRSNVFAPSAWTPSAWTPSAWTPSAWTPSAWTPINPGHPMPTTVYSTPRSNTPRDDALIGNTGHGLAPPTSAGNGAEQLRSNVFTPSAWTPINPARYMSTTVHSTPRSYTPPGSPITHPVAPSSRVYKSGGVRTYPASASQRRMRKEEAEKTEALRNALSNALRGDTFSKNRRVYHTIESDDDVMDMDKSAGNSRFQTSAASVQTSTPSVPPSAPADQISTPAIQAPTPSVQLSTPAIQAPSPSVPTMTPAIQGQKRARGRPVTRRAPHGPLHARYVSGPLRRLAPGPPSSLALALDLPAVHPFLHIHLHLKTMRSDLPVVEMGGEGQGYPQVRIELISREEMESFVAYISRRVLVLPRTLKRA
ncbi:hypothetical protein NA57DRAFT_78474 [Rhizodiscina lignyota]|uniref:Uncharacterized protein n=1 Tax=Rhizodiscina lignyota TaxID=1504668 RepID=A0A9P4IA44_9PEZI|nr:hypothetical protein NA57DRAFT_78474 [Rhizodiscina lignyota]